jgi:hypothetical protein
MFGRSFDQRIAASSLVRSNCQFRHEPSSDRRSVVGVWTRFDGSFQGPSLERPGKRVKPGGVLLVVDLKGDST